LSSVRPKSGELAKTPFKVYLYRIDYSRSHLHDNDLLPHANILDHSCASEAH